jgi:hypothetical protein
VVKHLPSKCEALNSNPSTIKKEREKKKSITKKGWWRGSSGKSVRSRVQTLVLPKNKNN